MAMSDNIKELMEKAGVSGEDVALVIPHQANYRIINEARRRIPDIAPEKFCINIDRYGNIYLATDRSVVVLAPTDTGYSQEGTLPSAPVEKPRFEIQPFFDEAGKPAAGLHLDADGEAYLVLGQDDSGEVQQVSITGPLGEEGSTVYTSCSSTEPRCGFIVDR